jgi:transposase
VIVLSNSPRERIGKWETCPIMKGQMVGARLAGVSVTKIVTLLGASRVTVSNIMSAYTNHGKTISAKRNGGQNSALTERDHRT